MTSDELLRALADLAGRLSGVSTAGQVDGEPAIGIEMDDGTMYFLTLEEGVKPDDAGGVDRTRYAPVLGPSSGLRWARRRINHDSGRPSRLHIADHAGRLLCDGGPGVSRSVSEPTLESQVHSLCLNVLRKRGLA